MTTVTPLSAQVHGTTVALNGAGVLLRGPSGAGKSDLALRLMERGAALVADDRTVLRAGPEGTVRASAPEALAGRVEVRGLGILAMPFVADCPVALVVDLVARDAVARVPMASSAVLLGVTIPSVALVAFDESTPLKVRLALEGVRRGTVGVEDGPPLAWPDTSMAVADTA